MPRTAQDRSRGGPFAALLILLSLLLGPAMAAAATSGERAPAQRLAPGRHGGAPALLAAARGALDDEAPGPDLDSSLAPSHPQVVTEALRSRPAAEAPSPAWLAVAQPACGGYRARAPPAF